MLNKTETKRLAKRLATAKAKRQRMAAWMVAIFDHAHKLQGEDLPPLAAALELPQAYVIDGRKALAMARYVNGNPY